MVKFTKHPQSKLVATSEIEKLKDPNDPNYIADQNIFLVAEVSNKTLI